MAKVLFSCTTFSTVPPRRCQHFFVNLRHAGIGSCTLCQRALWLLSPITTSWSRRQTNCHRTILVLNRASSRRLRSSGRKRPTRGAIIAGRSARRASGRQCQAGSRRRPRYRFTAEWKFYLRLPARPCHFDASIVEILSVQSRGHADRSRETRINPRATRSLVLASLRSATTA